MSSTSPCHQKIRTRSVLPTRAVKTGKESDLNPKGEGGGTSPEAPSSHGDGIDHRRKNHAVRVRGPVGGGGVARTATTERWRGRGRTVSRRLGPLLIILRDRPSPRGKRTKIGYSGQPRTSASKTNLSERTKAGGSKKKKLPRGRIITRCKTPGPKEKKTRSDREKNTRSTGGGQDRRQPSGETVRRTTKG